MLDSTETSAAGTAARAQRATAIAARDEAWRLYIEHTTKECPQCITTGANCRDAVILRQAWRDTRDAA